MNPPQLLLGAVMLATFTLLLPVLSSARSVDSQDSLEEEQSSSLHQIRKRSFHEIGCIGEYDASEYYRLVRVCRDCWYMYRDNDIYKMCREGCFANDVFEKCVDALLIDRAKEKIREKIDKALGRL